MPVSSPGAKPADLASTPVALLGTGRMGTALGLRLLAAGARLVVWNRTPERAGDLVAAGAKPAATPREAARGAAVVVSSLLDDAAVAAAVEGPDGLLAGLAPGAVHAGTTTASPAQARSLAAAHAAAGGAYVAAPVLGRPEAVTAGTARVLAAGPPGALDRAGAVLRALGDVAVVGSDPATAAATKLVANFVLASLLELFGEALVFGEASGVGTEHIRDVLERLVPSPALQAYAGRLARREHVPAGFALRTGRKDLRLVLDAADAAGVSLPMARATHERLVAADALGLGGQDWTAAEEVTRLLAGLDAALPERRVD